MEYITGMSYGGSEKDSGGRGISSSLLVEVVNILLDTLHRCLTEHPHHPSTVWLSLLPCHGSWRSVCARAWLSYADEGSSRRVAKVACTTDRVANRLPTEEDRPG